MTAKLHTSARQNKHKTDFSSFSAHSKASYTVSQKLHLHDFGPSEVPTSLTRASKSSRSVVFLKWLGRLFHKCVEYFTNVLWPLLTDSQWDCIKALADLALWLDLSRRVNSSQKYGGANLWIHLKTSVQSVRCLWSSSVGIFALDRKVRFSIGLLCIVKYRIGHAVILLEHCKMTVPSWYL